MKITTMPVGANSITIGGVTYTSIPAGGIEIPTTEDGQPLQIIEVDPVDGAGDVVINYQVIDNEGLISDNTGSVTIPFTSELTVDAGADAQICSSLTYTLQGNAANYDSVKWTTNGTGTFDDATKLDAVYTPSAGDIATGQVQLILSAVSGEKVLSDMMVLQIWQAAEAFAGIDATICKDDVFVLTAATAKYYTDLTWTTSGTGTFDNEKTQNPKYTPSNADLANGSVTLTMTLTGEGVCGTVTSSMVLNFTDRVIVNAGVDASICGGTPYTLQGTAEFTSDVVWSTSGTGTFDDATSLTATYTPSATDIQDGQVVLTLTGKNSCGTQADFMVLIIREGVGVHAGKDVDLCQGEEPMKLPYIQLILLLSMK